MATSIMATSIMATSIMATSIVCGYFNHPWLLQLWLLQWSMATSIMATSIVSMATSRSLPCPTDSFQNLAIPADSGGFWRNEIWQRALPNLPFQNWDQNVPWNGLEWNLEEWVNCYIVILLFILNLVQLFFHLHILQVLCGVYQIWWLRQVSSKPSNSANATQLSLLISTSATTTRHSTTTNQLNHDIHEWQQP